MHSSISSWTWFCIIHFVRCVYMFVFVCFTAITVRRLWTVYEYSILKGGKNAVLCIMQNYGSVVVVAAVAEWRDVDAVGPVYIRISENLRHRLVTWLGSRPRFGRGGDTAQNQCQLYCIALHSHTHTQSSLRCFSVIVFISPRLKCRTMKTLFVPNSFPGGVLCGSVRFSRHVVYLVAAEGS